MVVLRAAVVIGLAGNGAWAQGYPAPKGLPAPSVEAPGLAYRPSVGEAPPAEGAPVIYSYSDDAGPDETSFLTGRGLSAEVFVWGPSLTDPGGGPIAAKARPCGDDGLFLTPQQDQPDGPYLVWAGRQGQWSAPVRLNAPALWWCGPDRVRAGQTARVFGRNLSRRPDHARAFVYVCAPGKPGVWAPIVRAGKYAVEFRAPAELQPGRYEVWVHAGMGGQYGWGGPVSLTVAPTASDTRPVARPDGLTREALQRVIDGVAKTGGEVELAAGVYELDGTVIVPANVALRGRGVGETILQLSAAPGLKLARVAEGGWGLTPMRIHTPGDTLIYEIDVPQEGQYTVWIRYGTDMSPYHVEKMDDRTQLQVGNEPPVLLKNLPNTGSWVPTAWSRAATIHLPAGKQRLTWRNTVGGGLSLDAYVFAKDPAWNPGSAATVTEAPGLIVLQVEDVAEMHTKEAQLPGRTAAVVLLSGDNAALEGLTILGSDQVTAGVHVRSPKYPGYVHGARIERVRVADLGGKQNENCAVLIEHADHVEVTGCELTAQAPVYLRGLIQGRIIGNRLNSVTRIRGNAEAALLARNDVLRETIFEDNLLTSASFAGGPTQRRMIWVSTGAGSVDDNYFAQNRSEGQQFGGVAGTDQNVGEMILFEANLRLAYYGAPESADERSVTVPAAGPFLPPTGFDVEEPPASEYYVTVCKGPGLGQTRRVVGREERRFVLGEPWRVPPTAESLILITTLFSRNIVQGNETVNGMTGIQLWIGCVENIVTGNTIAHQRKPGIFLFGCYTTGEPVMPRTWNRGIGVFHYNHIEGNRVEESTDGILLTAATWNEVPKIEWPINLGNVLRHNSCVRSRAHGVNIAGNHTKAGAQAEERSIVGTVVEFNSVRDQPVAYLANDLTRATLFRRNHAYFWHTWTPDTKPVAYQVAGAADVTFEDNSTEGMSGTEDERIIGRGTEGGK